MPSASLIARYKAIQQKLLPVGVLWKFLSDEFKLFLESFAVEPARVQENMDSLITESLPSKSTAALLLSDWEQILLLPEERPTGSESEAQRQQVIAAKLYKVYNNPTKSFWIALGEKLGMTITPLDGSDVSAAVVARVEDALVEQDRVSDENDVFTWEIHVVSDPSGQLAKLKAIVNKLKPAHTSVIYT